MKRLSVVVIVVILAGLLLSGCGGAAAPAKIKIGTDATFPPFELVDEKTKELTGFDVELMKAVAQKAGWMWNSSTLASIRCWPASRSASMTAASRPSPLPTSEAADAVF